jgi:hypothetical protein
MIFPQIFLFFLLINNVFCAESAGFEKNYVPAWESLDIEMPDEEFERVRRVRLIVKNILTAFVQ